MSRLVSLCLLPVIILISTVGSIMTSTPLELPVETKIAPDACHFLADKGDPAPPRYRFLQIRRCGKVHPEIRCKDRRYDTAQGVGHCWFGLFGWSVCESLSKVQFRRLFRMATRGLRTQSRCADGEIVATRSRPEGSGSSWLLCYDSYNRLDGTEHDRGQ